MNIVHLNQYDVRGGAARAMYRLHEGFQAAGHQSRLVVGRQETFDDEVSQIGYQSSRLSTLLKKIWDNKVAPRLETHLSRDEWSHLVSWDMLRSPVIHNADVINLHNLHGGYFNVRVLPLLAAQKPIVWTLHDMWPLTGHCAYAYDCQRWRTGCYDCPLLKGSGRHLVEPVPTRHDRTRARWSRKRAIYQALPLSVITPSRWLKEIAQQSILAATATVWHVPNGIDVDRFKPLDQHLARQALDLPVDAQVIFFSAETIDNRRKGTTYLWQALAELKADRNIWLLTSGRQIDISRQAQRFNVRHLGYLSDEGLQRLAYTAADVFVLPSLADNQPLVVLEALACGTPVVAFDVGGIPEMVRHMQTGYLARYQDTQDLSHGIQLILENAPLKQDMRRACRTTAETDYALARQVQGYLEVYRQAGAMSETGGRV